MSKFIYLCFRYAILIHFILQIVILLEAGLGFNNFVLYAILINTGMIIYFSIVRGIMVGITNGEKILED
jgi:hypothetical protein